MEGALPFQFTLSSTAAMLMSLLLRLSLHDNVEIRDKEGTIRLEKKDRLENHSPKRNLLNHDHNDNQIPFTLPN